MRWNDRSDGHIALAVGLGYTVLLLLAMTGVDFVLYGRY